MPRSQPACMPQHALHAVRVPQVPLAPEDESLDDAAAAHLLPKVLVPFQTKPGETPRKVQIQR